MTRGPKSFFCNKMAIAQRRSTSRGAIGAVLLDSLRSYVWHYQNTNSHILRKIICDLGSARYDIVRKEENAGRQNCKIKIA